jgi:5-formyltetrahydrofolate cyclo-ligase
VSERYPDGVTPEEAEVLRGLAKEELRKRLAALRRTLASDTRQSYARAMSERLLAEPSFSRAQVVLAYSALRFEIDPRPIVERAWELQKTVVLPRIIPETRGLALHVYRPGDALVESGFVVQEPLLSAPQVDGRDIDLVLVPGLGFDLRGQRLGYGQGYYDRLLPALPRAERFGLTFELSLLVEVPCSAHDIPVDYLVTEKRLVRCEQARSAQP